MNKGLIVLLVASIAGNVLLWSRVARQTTEFNVRAASAAEVDALRKQMAELDAKAKSRIESATRSDETIELARLRNEVGQLREQVKAAQKPVPAPIAWRRLPATADWSEKFTAATNELAQSSKYIEELSSNHDLLISNLATASPQALEELKQRAQSRQCINNLKRIGLAALVWAIENGDKFPSDYISMREELGAPSVLFCPAAPITPPSDWAQLNPATITYTWHGTTADQQKPESVLTTCPVHGHVGTADGSARTRTSVWLK